jgi:hypothetical protein
MSSYKNNVHLEGNLGKDAEKKSTPNGDVVNFSIAVNEVCDCMVLYLSKCSAGLPAGCSVDLPVHACFLSDSGLGTVGEVRRHSQGRDAGNR